MRKNRERRSVDPQKTLSAERPVRNAGMTRSIPVGPDRLKSETDGINPRDKSYRRKSRGKGSTSLCNS